jgi:HD-GYP domain-containing protein (c-di-GMP phosphodiesterase class II)
MTNDRVYRKAIPEEQAWDEVRRNSGSQFDPAIVEIYEGLAAADASAAADGRAVTAAIAPA